ncbi:hypothetical protein, partial [Collinsella bouchesdurhonensis]|uniref:hypothetical protein n=1 Tax=Collinsella bouchesdurhonensis TaxID=1907654 RepID=UPI003F8C02FB
DDAETAPPGAVSVPDRCFRPLSWAYAGISPTETTEEPWKETPQELAALVSGRMLGRIVG